MRGRGVGKAIFEELKNIARKQDCGRMEWSVLNWNTPSIEFYENSLGAVPMDEWTVYRLTEF
jgi:GNAT superfamily N-acetyltransferase